MLNDKQRNVAYKQAIAYSITKLRHQETTNSKNVSVSSEGCSSGRSHESITVLDIGGGTGLLSMYAVIAGADHVYCCEMSTALAAIARQCIEDNGMSDKITIISKHSTALEVCDAYYYWYQ
jgi:predicted RNA methylase